jgi:hydroxyacylglutathione hydrolase
MKVFPLACSFDNYSYLLVCEQTGLCGVVDPTEAYPVWKKAEGLSAQLTKVFCTHHHYDHVGGLADLLNEQPDLEVYGYRTDESRIPGMNHPLHDGDKVKLGEQEGWVLHTPGHTDGSVCYLFNEHLFTGDTLFGGGCGRLFEGSPEQMHRSLSKIMALPESTKLYFGHEYSLTNLAFAMTVEGENPAVRDRYNKVKELVKLDFPTVPSTLFNEKQTNPFLRCDSATIRESLGDTAGAWSDVEVFRLLREMRNSFTL